MGYEIQGEDVELGHEVYTRKAKHGLREHGMSWAREVQGLLDAGEMIEPPTREAEGRFEGVLTGLHMLQAGDVRGGKIDSGEVTVVAVADPNPLAHVDIPNQNTASPSTTELSILFNETRQPALDLHGSLRHGAMQLTILPILWADDGYHS